MRFSLVLMGKVSKKKLLIFEKASVLFLAIPGLCSIRQKECYSYDEFLKESFSFNFLVLSAVFKTRLFLKSLFTC